MTSVPSWLRTEYSRWSTPLRGLLVGSQARTVTWTRMVSPGRTGARARILSFSSNARMAPPR